MADIISSLGAQLGESTAQSKSSTVQVGYATVTAIHSYSADVRLDVSMYGGTLYGIPMTTACRGVAVGDRVIVQTYGHLSTVTGVIAHEANPAQKILWSGNSWMSAAHTRNLSENVSDQENGIVLHWQRYTDSTVRNYNHNYVFVPKSHVADFAGAGVGMILSGGGSRMCIKYIYVYDSYLVGNDINITDQTIAGVVCTPTEFVLTQVIGV